VILANFASLLPTDTSALESSISALESSISALDSAIPALDRSVKSWEYVGFAGALLVVVGVLLELHDIWHRHGEEITTWALSYFGVSRSVERPKFFKKFGVEVASVILVAGGVGCELGAGFMIESKNVALRAIDIQLRSKNAALRSASEQLLALVTQQAGEAKDNAGIAKESAKEAKRLALEVNGIASAARDKANGAEDVARKAETKIEAVDRRAVELRDAVEALGPRSLSLEQQRDIAWALKSYRLHPTVVESYGMDGEGTALAWQLIVVLHAATGLPVADSRANKIVSGGFEWGISIRGPESERAFMDALQNSLTLIGHLKNVTVNGPERRGSAMVGGAAMTGGGGQVQPPTIPASGPVLVMVGIKPPVIPPAIGK